MSSTRSSTRQPDPSERARYATFLSPSADRAAVRAKAVPDSIVTEAIWVARTVAVLLPALSFLLVFGGDVIDALGSIWLGLVVLGAAVALLASSGRIAMAHMGQTGVALTCAAIALAIPIADIAVEHRVNAAAPGEGVAGRQPDAWDDLQTLVSDTTNAGSCSRIELAVAQGMTAALSCASANPDLATSAEYYEFALPEDAESFYAHALPSDDALVASDSFGCTDDETEGTFAADSEYVVWTNVEKRLVMIAERGYAAAHDDREAWDLHVC